MNARVVTVRLNPDTIDEAVRFFRESVAPAFWVHAGFDSTRFLTDRDTGDALLVTVWQSEADLWASETSGFLREQLGRLARFFASAPSVRRYTIDAEVGADA